MKKFLLIWAVIILALSNQKVNAQANVLDPNDPDVVFTSSNKPALPSYGVISKWGHTNRLDWNPYTYGYKSYYFKGMAFRLKFPKTYKHNVVDGKTYPAIIFLHGLGEPGPVYDNEIHLVHGALTHAQNINNGTFDGFMIYPQSQGGYLQNYFPVIKDLVDSLIKYVKLDADRLHVGGLSSGGQAAWDFLDQQQYAKMICAEEVISAARYDNVPYLGSHITVPFILANGGQDAAPSPPTVTDIINDYKNLGGNITQFLYPDQGHGCWDSFWAEPGYWPFVNAQHKANPLVYYQHYKFCPGETVSAKLGVQDGFYAYQWSKNGTVIPGATSASLNVTDYGTYAVHFKRTSSSAWSLWSPTPAVISQNTATVSPNIQIDGLHTSILPAPDGSTTVPLKVPANYVSYEWRRVSDNGLVSSTNTYNAPVGQYKIKVTEQFGCGSDFSGIFSVISASGNNLPDAASSLTAVALSNNVIQLDWNDNPNAVNNETGFEIYRSKTAGGPYTLINITAADILTYSDGGLVPNTRYYYLVRAVNNNGAAANSTEANALTASDVTPPTAPRNLVITGSDRTSVSLSWDASTDDVGVTKYEVYVNGAKTYVTSGTTFTVNNLTSLQTYGFSIKATDAAGNLSPASNQVNGTAQLNGLSYKYYEGAWNVLPDFSTLTPVATGVTPNVDISKKLHGTNYGFVWTGNIIIPTTGSYTFETSSDDGSKLYIGPWNYSTTALVNNDGLHGTQSATGTITLTAGVYPISMVFFQLGGGDAMQVYWKSTAAGIARQLIPNSAFADNVTIPATSLPTKPSNLLVTATSYNTSTITWADNSTTETGFEVVRSTDQIGTYVSVGTVAANVTSFIDSVGLSASTIYWYKVRAINSYGPSDFISILEGSWGLNSNYNDASGNNRNLAAGASPTFNTTDKKEGTASLSLNGTTQYADMTFSASKAFASNAYTTRTVSAWIKPTAATIAGTNKFVWELGGSDNGLALRFNAGSLQAGIAKASTRYTAVVNNVATSTGWVNGGWNHVTVVYNNTTLKLFINGVEKVSTNLSATALAGSTSLSRIGASNTTNAFNTTATSSFYAGLIDDVNIITEPLVASGVLALMTDSYGADTTYALPGVPAAPSIQSATPVSSTSVSLVINDNSTNETGFDIYRSVNTSNNFKILAKIPANNTSTINYSDNDLFANTNYYYQVRATGVGGNSAFSATAPAKTLDHAPVFTDVTSFTMRFDGQKTLTINATDSDAEVLTFSFANPLPSFATFNNTGNGSGSIAFNPTPSSLGVYPITMYVADGNGGKDTLNFTLTVNNNYVPVATTIGNTNVNEGTITNLSLSATDQDGNSTLAWTLTTAPSFVTLTDNGNGVGNIKIAPTFANAGVYPIKVTVNDGSGGLQELTFTLTVADVVPPVERIFMSMKYDSPNATAPWNNISTPTTNNLLNGDGVSTAVGIDFVGTSWNAGNAGTVTYNNSGVYPDAVIKDYFWFGVYGAPNTIDVNLRGLTPSAKYNVTLFGSSNWTGLGNNGTTVYTINSVAKPLYVDNNKTNTVTFSSIAPNASGIITVNLSKGAGSPYGMVNAIVLEKPFDDGTTPVLPTAFAGQALSNGTVKLSWNDIAYNESAYNVYRATNIAGPFTLLSPSPSANDSTYIDNTVLSSTTYYYKIEAINAVGTSGYTNVVSVTTLNKAPVLAVIADVYAKATLSTSVAIAATDDAGNVLTVSVTGLPSFATYNSTGNGTGNIVITPSVNDIGVYSGITVKITDNFGASVTRVFNLTVIDNSIRSVYLNFGQDGSTPQAAPWNNFIGYPFANNNYGNISDDSGVPTGFTFKLLSQWNGGLSSGMRTGNNTGIFPDNVMRSGFYTNASGNQVIEFDGLNPTKRYSIGFLTNLNTGAASVVTFTNGTQTVSVDGKYNTTVLANLNGLTPAANGSIQVTMAKASANPSLEIAAVVIREFGASDPVVRPADLFAETALATDRIKLTWSDRSADETGFEIYRSTSANGTYTLVTTTAANVTTYLNTGLTANTRYYYKIRAKKSTTFSSYSNVANAILASKIVLVHQNVDPNQAAASPWNNTSSASTANATFSNLINTTLTNSGFQMVITKEFNGTGYAGVTTAGIFPANVQIANYWTDAGQTSQVKFVNLDVSKKYRVGFFGSNTNSNYAIGNYTCNGRTVELNSYYNDSKVVYLDKLTPGPDGELILSVNTAGGSPYSFTNAYTIEYFDDNTPDDPIVNTIYTDLQPQTNSLKIGEHILPELEGETIPVANTIDITKTVAPTATVIDDAKVISVFPNPFTNLIKVELQNQNAKKVSIMLSDISGNVIFKTNQLNVMKGHNIVGANLPVGLKLSPGSYIITVWVDGKLSKATKLIKVN
ncbi:MAG: fibronectin type III domain-containing protein [Ferruginibacter sp.]